VREPHLVIGQAAIADVGREHVKDAERVAVVGLLLNAQLPKEGAVLTKLRPKAMGVRLEAVIAPEDLIGAEGLNAELQASGATESLDGRIAGVVVEVLVDIHRDAAPTCDEVEQVFDDLIDRRLILDPKPSEIGGDRLLDRHRDVEEVGLTGEKCPAEPGVDLGRRVPMTAIALGRQPR
jgi:hypothetical protein